ncbi:sorbitol dehydrogenase [Artemisia annua]|uniref:Sorbitol dehydrogenase n=1 Tax=Artemisia annua TaxID=35608 RepID=A0A2U1QK32_ARTAN|nr:sorbitol dehydrogenase [Artemisia annua]
MWFANLIVKKPMVIGHECAGIIKDIKSNVKTLAVGDRVALEPGISWQTCNLCRIEVFKLPDNVSLEEGVMCEPLTAGVHACRRADATPAARVLIIGAEPIGLVTMLAARAFGAPKIIIADVDHCQLSIARNLGADDTIQVSTNMQDVGEVTLKIYKIMGESVDISFDCVGFDKTISTTLNPTRAGGKVCLVGLGHSPMTSPLVAAASSNKVFF